MSIREEKDVKKNQDEEINKEIVKSVISRGIPVEKFFELGGEIITVGADAHKPEHVAYDFDKVSNILKDAGFMYYTVFENRVPAFIKL